MAYQGNISKKIMVKPSWCHIMIIAATWELKGWGVNWLVGNRALGIKILWPTLPIHCRLHRQELTGRLHSHWGFTILSPTLLTQDKCNLIIIFYLLHRRLFATFLGACSKEAAGLTLTPVFLHEGFLRHDAGFLETGGMAKQPKHLVCQTSLSLYKYCWVKAKHTLCAKVCKSCQLAKQWNKKWTWAMQWNAMEPHHGKGSCKLDM